MTLSFNVILYFLCIVHCQNLVKKANMMLSHSNIISPYTLCLTVTLLQCYSKSLGVTPFIVYLTHKNKYDLKAGSYAAKIIFPKMTLSIGSRSSSPLERKVSNHSVRQSLRIVLQSDHLCLHLPDCLLLPYSYRSDD